MYITKHLSYKSHVSHISYNTDFRRVYRCHLYICMSCMYPIHDTCICTYIHKCMVCVYMMYIHL